MSLLPSSKSMDSSTTSHHHIARARKECGITFPAACYTSSHRTPSISSSSSFSSCWSSNFHDEYPSSPATPLCFKGVPFSWEHSPGIPKSYSSHSNNNNNKDQSLTSTNKVLPLPPQVSKKFDSEEVRIRKKISSESFGRDPFFAALVECSKEEDHIIGAKTESTRSITDRFGFINLYTSCKRTCAVSDSIVYLPRSRNSYDLVTRQPR